jgi:hypothetical protein
LVFVFFSFHFLSLPVISVAYFMTTKKPAQQRCFEY